MLPPFLGLKILGLKKFKLKIFLFLNRNEPINKTIKYFLWFFFQWKEDERGLIKILKKFLFRKESFAIFTFISALIGNSNFLVFIISEKDKIKQTLNKTIVFNQFECNKGYYICILFLLNFNSLLQILSIIIISVVIFSIINFLTIFYNNMEKYSSTVLKIQKSVTDLTNKTTLKIKKSTTDLTKKFSKTQVQEINEKNKWN